MTTGRKAWLAFLLVGCVEFTWSSTAVRAATSGSSGRDPVYAGVSYDISASQVAKWRRAGRPTPTPEQVVDQLMKGFSEAVEAYNEGKGKLPLCLQDATDRLLADLRSGARTLHIEWETFSNLGWNQAMRTSPLNDADTVVPLGGTNATIHVRNNPSTVSWFHGSGNCFYSAAATIFHELVHAASFMYPMCFRPEILPEFLKPAQQVRFEEEVNVVAPPQQSCNEQWTQDAQLRVFPQECPTYPTKPKCVATYERICVCGPNCP